MRMPVALVVVCVLGASPWVRAGEAAPPPVLPDVPAWTPERLKAAGVKGDPRWRSAGMISSIQPLADGKRVLISGRDGSARLWDVETGEELKRYHHGKVDSVWTARVTADGKALLTASEDGVLRKLNLESGAVEYSSPEFRDGVYRLAELDEKRVLVATYKDGAQVVPLAGGKAGTRLAGTPEKCYGVARSPDGATLAVAGSDNHVRLFAAETLKPGLVLKGHSNDPYTLVFSPDSRVLYSSGDDNSVRAWAVADGAKLWDVDLEKTTHAVAVSPDGTLLAVTVADGSLRLLNAADGKVVREMKMPASSAWSVAFSPDGASVYAGGDGLLYRWETASGKRLVPSDEALARLSTLERVWWTANGALLVRHGDRGWVEWSRSAEQPVRRPVLEDARGEIRAVSADGARVAVIASSENEIRIVDAGLKETLKFKLEQGSRRAAFALNGEVLVSGDSRGGLYVHDTATGALRLKLKGHTDDINDLAVSPSQKLLATVGDDQSLRLWTPRNHTEVAVLESPDGNRFDAVWFLGENGMLAQDSGGKVFAWFRTEGPVREDKAKTSIQELVKQLGAADFHARQAAVDGLIAHGAAAQAAVEALPTKGNAELAYRVRQVLDGLNRGSVPVQRLSDALELPGSLHELAGHPDGRHFVVVMNRQKDKGEPDGPVPGPHRRVMIGRLTESGPALLFALPVLHTPESVAFSPDGRELVVGSGEGLLEFFSISAPEARK